jgi:drug/metabolite transporter (DMT)-like permease
MRIQDNVIARRKITGTVFLAAVGVLAFSFSLPATRLAVHDLDPWLVAFGRAAVAAVLATGYLRCTTGPWPDRAQWFRLGLVACGVVIGFPVFTSLALITQTSAHSAVVTAGLPMSTAVWAVLRAGERPRAAFWVASLFGLLAVLAFILVSGDLRGGLEPADVFLLAAVVLAGLGYAEGGVLSRDLGGARTVSLALVLALPVTAPISVVIAAGEDFGGVGLDSWLGFGYVSVVSMYLGFFAWYAALARGGVARVGQIQLIQPVLTLAWSGLLLGEAFGTFTVFAGLAVLTCVVAAQRSRIR